MRTDCRALAVGDGAAPWNQDEALGAEFRPLLTAWQVAALDGRGGERPAWLEEAAVTVPDFLNYARLLSTGQAGQVAALPGSLYRVARAGLSVVPFVGRNVLGAARKDFWVVAGTLLRYDLALLPNWHRGPVLLHAQVADMAFAMERRNFVVDGLGLLRGAGREVGLHTQQVGLALSCLGRWGVVPDVMGALWLPGDRAASAAWEAARRMGGFEGVKLLGEATSHPGPWVGALRAGMELEDGLVRPDEWLVPVEALF